MTKLINYEDSLYIILTRIHLIRDLLALDADSSLFLNKTLDDIDFIDHSLELINAELAENRFLAERESLLDHLSELEWQFYQILTELIRDEKGFLPEESENIKSKLTVVRSRSEERRKKAENNAVSASSSAKTLHFEPVVSSNELDELLRAL